MFNDVFWPFIFGLLLSALSSLLCIRPIINLLWKIELDHFTNDKVAEKRISLFPTLLGLLEIVSYYAVFSSVPQVKDVFLIIAGWLTIKTVNNNVGWSSDKKNAEPRDKIVIFLIGNLLVIIFAWLSYYSAQHINIILK